jgi:membrane-bound lytic murein transglycosylase MltF
MQIKPSTARSPEIGVPDVSGLEDNINAGTKYIRFLMDKYYADLSGDRFNQTLIAFAGYNAGPNRIANLRKKARERGLDDTKWFNNLEWVVAESVGSVTVNYVRNIFQYFIVYSSVYERHLQREKLKTQ